MITIQYLQREFVDDEDVSFTCSAVVVLQSMAIIHSCAGIVFAVGVALNCRSSPLYRGRCKTSSVVIHAKRNISRKIVSEVFTAILYVAVPLDEKK